MDRNTGSKIPRFSGSKTYNGYEAEPLPNIGSGHKPSRLEQMQVDYQRGIMREKEEKMIQLYEDTQQKALHRVQKKGHVRDFFNERRVAGGGGHDSHLSPTMDALYQQKKSESQYSGFDNVQNGPKMSPKYTNYNSAPRGVQKQSAGRDRSNLLAPIQKNGQQDNENPFAKRKPQIVRPRTYGQQRNKENNRNGFVPSSAPTGNTIDNFSNHGSVYGTDGIDDDSPPPNAQQLHQLQQKRKMLQSQRSHNRSMHTRTNGSAMSNTTSNTGYPRKTPESLRKGNNRSRNTYEFDPSDEDEGFADNNSGGDDDIKKKQQELLAQIEAQQRELNKLRKERKDEEEQEQHEKARRKKVEEERRKRQAEEERRQKRAEEERRQQELEEEKREAEKRRMKQTQNSYGNSGGGQFNNFNQGGRYDEYEEKQPTPPPKPKPANTRKPVPQKRPQAKQRSPSPPLNSGDNIAIYENAINEDGAFESVGKLRACYNCGRKFAMDRIQKHESACKNATKKRKVMDPTKMRTAGTEMAQYSSHRKSTPPQVKAKKGNWRSKHESFIEAIRYAKKCSQIEKGGGNLADLPPPPRSENPDYVQCPHCSRKFNESAAERHIPHCANTKNRAKPPPRRR